MQPFHRSALRRKLGRLYYTCRRYLEWYRGTVDFARTRTPEALLYVCSRHRTPLLRPLRNVDMWLQHNKVKNLRLATTRLDGVIVRPGETFSFWRLLGKPTRRKGYLEGMVLHSGMFRPGVGGGLCQLSNLIYWLSLHTSLAVTERHRHSYDVFPDVNRTQPFGSGATCVFNFLDLQVKNRTQSDYQLRVWLDDTHLNGEWRSREEPDYRYEVYEREHRIDYAPWGGYLRHNIIARRVFDRAGGMVADEYVTENHALMMYPPFLPAGELETGSRTSGGEGAGKPMGPERE